MSAPPVPPAPAWSEAERLDALIQTGLLDSPPEQAYDDVVALVRAICRVPIALVSLVDADRQWFKARSGTDAVETPIETSVCALAIQQHGLFEIRDLAADPRTADFALVRDDPHIRYYAGMPLLTAKGLPLGSLCAIDVVPHPEGLSEEQRTSLEALARRTVAQIELSAMFRQREEALSASTGVGTWDWDVQRDRVVADVRFAAIYGVDPELAARGVPIGEFFRNVAQDDLPRLQADVQDALRTGHPFNAEYRVRGQDGTRRWLAAQGRAMLDIDGTALRFPGISFDITDRKDREARAAALLALSDSIRDVADPGEIIAIGCRILGETLDTVRVGYGLIDPVAETITTRHCWLAAGVGGFSGALHFRDYGSYIDDLKQGDAVVIDDVETDPRTADRAPSLQALDINALINLPLVEHGAFVALLFVNEMHRRVWTVEEVVFVREVAERVRSATERRRAEQELAALNAELEGKVEERTRALMAVEEQLRQSHKMEAVGQLTGGLAHDFNNMLTGISGALEMMQIRIGQGRITELDRYATAARGAATRAAALTHRLLAFSRRQTLDPKPTDANRLIAGMEDLVRRTVGPQVTVEVAQAAGLWASCIDQNQLENALLNLCINARDAMPDGGRITIETANKWLDARTARERDLPPGQYISLCVTDAGAGMKPEVKARAFDPFFTTKPMGEGTGLGLSMVYGFVRQSGGQVRIYTEVGQGTTMCLYLPRHYGDAEMPVEDAVAEIPRAEQGQTVLIVDDEPTIRMLVIEVLEELGYATLEAGDGASALRLLQSDARIDLLVTDVGLPGAMNGRQVADAARVRRPELGVLFITGYAENAVVGNGHLDPGMELVTKPFAIETLAQRIRGMLQR